MVIAHLRKSPAAIGARLSFDSKIARSEFDVTHQPTSSSINHQIHHTLQHAVRSFAFYSPNRILVFVRNCLPLKAYDILSFNESSCYPVVFCLSVIFCLSSVTFNIPRYGPITRAGPSRISGPPFSSSPTLLLLHGLSRRLRQFAHGIPTQGPLYFSSHSSCTSRWYPILDL